MKLLLDQNISYRVVRKLSEIYAVVETVRDHGLYEKGDRTSWEHGRKNGHTIVTFDEDLYNLATLYGPPPKIIWFRTGNLTNDEVAELLIRYHSNIDLFVNDEFFEKDSCLAIYFHGTTNL